MARQDLIEVVQAYEFKPNHHYLIEVKSHQVSKDQLYEASMYFEDQDIHALFVSTAGEGFALRAVPAIETTPIKESK